MFWEQEIETMERGALERLQLTLLQRSLRQAARSPYYRDRLSGGLPTTLADVVRLPFTTKDDLRNNFP
jgi:phenylacetate-CoA ligase